MVTEISWEVIESVNKRLCFTYMYVPITLLLTPCCFWLLLVQVHAVGTSSRAQNDSQRAPGAYIPDEPLEPQPESVACSNLISRSISSGVEWSGCPLSLTSRMELGQYSFSAISSGSGSGQSCRERCWYLAGTEARTHHIISPILAGGRLESDLPKPSGNNPCLENTSSIITRSRVP